MKFAVVGAGGVGGYFGGKLARNGEDVWFIARGGHLRAMRSGGLSVNSTDENFVIPPGKMIDDPSAIGNVDVVLFCVKSYSTESATIQIEPLVGNKTIVINLQNGVDNEEKMVRILKQGVVYGGVSYIYSTITAPGVITHTVGPTKILFGAMGTQSVDIEAKANQVLKVMTGAGINASLTDDIEAELWKKFIFIAAVGGMTALTRLTLGGILGVAETKQMLVDAMRETELVGRARNINIPAKYSDQVFDVITKFDNNSRSSLYHDLVHDKPLEIDALSGTVVRYGKESGIPTPVHRAIYSALLPYHLKRVKERSSLERIHP